MQYGYGLRGVPFVNETIEPWEWLHGPTIPTFIAIDFDEFSNHLHAMARTVARYRPGDEKAIFSIRHPIPGLESSQTIQDNAQEAISLTPTATAVFELVIPTMHLLAAAHQGSVPLVYRGRRHPVSSRIPFSKFDVDNWKGWKTYVFFPLNTTRRDRPERMLDLVDAYLRHRDAYHYRCCIHAERVFPAL